MIVRKSDPAWEIIFQPAHALLAGNVAMELSPDLRSHRWFETIVAITIHDDHPETFEAAKHFYVTKAGIPRDFTEVGMEENLRFEEAQLCVVNAYRKSPWIGVLRSYHTHVLYEKENISKSFRQFLEMELTQRRDVLRHLGLKTQDLKDAYAVMQFCDRCSLILCQDEIPEMERILEISTLHSQSHTIWKRDDDSVGVQPWPFASDSFMLEVMVYRLAQAFFSDDAALGNALKETKPTKELFEFRRG